MAADIAGIVGQQNMNLGAKEEVIAILQNLPIPATAKRFLYARWARVLGAQAMKEDIDRVAPWNQGA
jgi:hypothetical protein